MCACTPIQAMPEAFLTVPKHVCSAVLHEETTGLWQVGQSVRSPWRRMDQQNQNSDPAPDHFMSFT